MRAKPTASRFDLDAISQDMLAKGWLQTDLARAAGVSDMTVTRFLRSERQTARTAKKIARALGRSVRHYLLTADEKVA